MLEVILIILAALALTFLLICVFALIGMAYICDDYPLYYDATNEKGLSMAGLNFPGNAVYMQPEHETLFLGSFEIIPWMLGLCTTVAEVKEHLKQLVIADVLGINAAVYLDAAFIMTVPQVLYPY